MPGARRRFLLGVSIFGPRRYRRAAAGLADWLVQAAPGRARGHVEVALLSTPQVRTLNRRFRRVDRSTDVLSFPSSDPLSRPEVDRGDLLGEIVIAMGVARRQARAAGHSLGTELRVLALHGLLHLLGYDHERDAGTMRRLEGRLRRKGRLREGLIERTQKRRAL